jgi:very-short-patch-repair endonuclease
MKKRTEEHKTRTSETLKRLWASKAYRERMVKIHNSPKTLEKHRKTGLNSINPEMLERARKLGASSKGKPSPRLGAKLSQETKDKLSEYNNRPNILLAHRLRGQSIAKRVRKSGTDIEIKIWNLLRELNIKFKSNSKLGFFVPDILIENKKLIIECDGDYWHSSPESIKRLKYRDKEFKKLGYSVLHLKGSIIYHNMELCKKLILSKV